MRDQLQIGGEFDPVALYNLQGEMLRLRGALSEFLSSAISTDVSQSQELVKQAHRLMELLKRSGLEEFLKDDLEELTSLEKQLEALAMQSSEANLPALAHCEETFSDLRRHIEESLDKLLVVSPQRLYIPLDELLDVGKMFRKGEYEFLPYEAQLDFKEAGLCYLFEQYTATVMLSFRSAEATVREYYYRVTDSEAAVLTWEAMLKGMEKASPEVDKEVIEELEAAKKKRNKYAHPRMTSDRPDAHRASLLMRGAVNLCCCLIDDLRKRKKALAAIARHPLDFDEALALWILDQRGDGIGRKRFFKEDEESLIELQGSAIIIGAKEGDFKWDTNSDTDCIARRMACRYDLEDTYARLLDFACRLRIKRASELLVESETPEETLEMILESLGELYGEESEKYLSLAWKIIRVIHSQGMDPFAPNLARNLRDKLPSEFVNLVARAAARIENRKKKRQCVCRYDLQKCLVLQSAEPLPHDHYHEAYPYVFIYNTKTGELIVSYNGRGSATGLKPIYRALKARNYEVINKHWRLESESPIRNLPFEEMIEIIKKAEEEARARV